MDKIDPARLAGQVYVAAKATFAELLKTKPLESFYVFGLWTDDSMQFLYPMANTEEALTARVKHYQAEVDPKYGITSSDASLRWSYGDWGYASCDEGGHFDAINDQLSEYFNFTVDFGEDELDDETEEAFMAVVDEMFNAVATGLHRLDDDGFFGTGAAREKITLMIVGDIAPELIEASVQVLNPPAVYERYLKIRDALDS